MANLIMDSPNPPPDWTAETTYLGISNYRNNRMGITNTAMNELRTHLSFTQLRFHCRKQQGRTFHVTAVLNFTGEAVVRYFSGQTNVLPASCGSFVKMEDDTSYLADKCSAWGNDGAYYVGKWGHHNKQGGRRLYDQPAFVAYLHHWKTVSVIWRCDDRSSDTTFSRGDFWKIFVR